MMEYDKTKMLKLKQLTKLRCKIKQILINYVIILICEINYRKIAKLLKSINNLPFKIYSMNIIFKKSKFFRFNGIKNKS